MLGGDLVPMLKSEGGELCLTSLRTEEGLPDGYLPLDITNAEEVDGLVAKFNPDWIVNCAAYTAVDAAESDKDTALAVNADGPKNLAIAGRKVGAKLLHFSTDYVFGGGSRELRQDKPYEEHEQASPCGVYGATKYLGEENIRDSEVPHLILRTSWLHGRNGPNFLDTMLRVARDKSEIKVVDDQIGSPTWTMWLSEMAVRLIEKDAAGTFHVTSRGNISWCDFAREIFAQAGLDIKVSPQTTAELGRPAPRPAFSTLNVGKLEEFLGVPCITWEKCVSGHLAQTGALGVR